MHAGWSHVHYGMMMIASAGQRRRDHARHSDRVDGPSEHVDTGSGYRSVTRCRSLWVSLCMNGG